MEESAASREVGVGGRSRDERVASRGPALLQPLRVRDYRLVFAGETISVLGDQFHFVALAWLALQLTGSGLALGTVLMTAAIPRAIFILVGGAFSDRFSPRTLMLVSNAIRASSSGSWPRSCSPVRPSCGTSTSSRRSSGSSMPSSIPPSTRSSRWSYRA